MSWQGPPIQLRPGASQADALQSGPSSNDWAFRGSRDSNWSLGGQSDNWSSGGSVSLAGNGPVNGNVTLSWGNDSNGRLGHGSFDNHEQVPKNIGLLANVEIQSLSCGSGHTVVAARDGRCITWGKGQYGQLGQGDDKDRYEPTVIRPFAAIQIAMVAAGDSHCLAISSNGDLFSWGAGFFGCLGHGDEQARPSPAVVGAFRGYPVASIAAGGFQSFAINATGAVCSWGRNQYGEIGQAEQTVRAPKELVALRGRPVARIFAGVSHTLIAMQGGGCVALGLNENGQLGTNDKNNRNVPEAVKNLDGLDIVSAACGKQHTIAASSDGRAFGWGCGALGRLGLGHELDEKAPRQIPALQGKPVARVACGDSFSLAVTQAGETYFWGVFDGSGRGVGHNMGMRDPPPPTAVASLGEVNIKQISAGPNHIVVSGVHKGAVSIAAAVDHPFPCFCPVCSPSG